jgi:lipopolysaccharide/colanic/teichoic acid biosynthesis glycosyltransferase
LTVRPGITGYWQVEGRQTTSYKERVQMDEYYITHWSLTFDLKILVKTVPAVLLRRGAM